MGDDGRRMVYPITTPQQIKHFPYRFYWNYFPKYRELIAASILCVPIFYWLQQLTLSPSNVKKYEECMAKEEREYQHHLRHLEGYYEDRGRH